MGGAYGVIGPIFCEMIADAYSRLRPRPRDSHDLRLLASAWRSRCLRFAHLADDRGDLGRLLEPRIRIRTVGLTNFADRKKTETLLLVATMNGAMHEGFDYVRREDEGTTTGHVEMWRCS
jgi:hypothetical protein